MTDHMASSKHVLDPIDRVSEVLFGLIMVLTFTGSLSAATAGHAEIRTMLIGALGCNLSWGVIDALFYLMGCLAEKGRGLVTLHSVRGAADPEEGRRLVASGLPAVVAGLLDQQHLEAVRLRLVGVPEPPARPTLEKEDWLAAAGVCLLVFASTFPVVIPFFFGGDPTRALRLSNGIAIAMLFACGYSVGRMTNYHPWGTGFVVVLLGCALVAMTMALGG